MHRREIIRLLRSRAVGITNNRIWLMEFLYANQNKLTSLQEILKNEEKQVTRTSTYRNLIILTDVGLVYKLVDINNKAYYNIKPNVELRPDAAKQSKNEHYHFQCKYCNSIVSLPQIFKLMKLPPGFVQTGSNLLITGYCPDCAIKHRHSIQTTNKIKKTFSNVTKQ